MRKPEENQMRKKILVKALGKNLDKMSKSPWVGSLKDGKDLICPFCDQPVQPCKSNPSATCERMLRGGTEGKELEQAIKDCDKNQYSMCISCDKEISTSHLKKHPTADICTECVKKGKKTKSKKVA
jgi:RNA polymerase-binding transcription factor DksA